MENPQGSIGEKEGHPQGSVGEKREIPDGWPEKKGKYPMDGQRRKGNTRGRKKSVYLLAQLVLVTQEAVVEVIRGF